MAAPIIGGLIQIIKSYVVSEIKSILNISYLLRVSHVQLLKELFHDPKKFAQRLGKLNPLQRKKFSQDIERVLKAKNAPFKGTSFKDEDIFKSAFENSGISQIIGDTTVKNSNFNTTRNAKSINRNVIPPKKPKKGTPTSNKDLEYATYTRQNGKTKYASEKQINQRVLDLMKELGLTEEEAKALLKHQIDEGSEFQLLSSSWIQSGEYKAVALGIGELTISVIATGKAYTYFGVVPQVWEAMKAAKGKNGSGAGTVFWALYLRGYKKSFYGRMQETIRELLGNELNETLSKKAKKVVNLFPQITTAQKITKKVKKVVKNIKKGRK